MEATLLSPSIISGNVIFESRLADAVKNALQTSDYVELRGLRSRVDGGRVFLSGHLPSYYLKQLTHHRVSSIDGVTRIIDEIDVIN